MDLGHWIFDKEFNPEDWYGFIYRIRDLTTNQEYIGKKCFFNQLRKVVKHRKNRKIIKKESNWRTYTSSSTHLNHAIDEKGKDNFEFFIESLHKTKGSLTYAEVRMQILENVLTEKLPNSLPRYYNRQISAIKFIPPDLLPEEKEMTRKKI